MDLDETWQVGLRPEKTKPCTFPAKLHYGFRRECERMGRRGVVFCDLNDAPLLPLSLDRFPPNFPQTRLQVVARDTWFLIQEKFPLRGRISQKNHLFRVQKVTPFMSRLLVTGKVLRCLDCFQPRVDISHMCLN